MKKICCSAVVAAFALAVWAADAMTPYPEGKKAAIAFTFDDATLDQYEAALPILEHTVYAAYNACPASDKDLFCTGGDHNTAVEEAVRRAEDFLARRP